MTTSLLPPGACARAVRALSPRARLSAIALCMLALSAQGQAQTLDQEKLKLLSCAMPKSAPAESKQAHDWLKQVVKQSETRALAGPIRLGQACLANVKATASFGMVMVSGEICNPRTEDFSAALLAVGVKLEAKAVPGEPDALLTARKGDYAFTVLNGPMDAQTMAVKRGAKPLSFLCMNKGPAPK